MPLAIVQRLTAELQRLLTAMPSIEAAAVVSHDGLAMASLLPDGLDEEHVSAVAAALLGLAERASTTLGRGELQQMLIDGDDGYLCIMDVRHRALLVAMVRRVGKVGLLRYEMRAVADAVAAILQSAASAAPSGDGTAPAGGADVPAAAGTIGESPADAADDVGAPVAPRHLFVGSGADSDVQGG